MQRILEGKVVIVNAGGTVIGSAISKVLARQGACVVVAGTHNEPVDEVVWNIQENGGTAVSYKADLSNEELAKDCIQHAIRMYGKLDILINNTNLCQMPDKTENISLDNFFLLVRGNMQAGFLLIKHALPELQKTKGCIVASGSDVGIDGEAENSIYAGTKGFINAFIKSVAQEQAKYGVRANLVTMGLVDTANISDLSNPVAVKLKNIIRQSVPMMRLASPEEIANVFLFLASPLASYVTGANYHVDGGKTLSKSNSLTTDTALNQGYPASLLADRIH